MTIQKIISGGQTGVDRAGLDFAIRVGIPHGGFCPKNRRSENGRIPDKYNLTETPYKGYPSRTCMNVEHSDGTLIVFKGSFFRFLCGGTRQTLDICKELDKPRFVVDLRYKLKTKKFVEWVRENNIQVLNIAGQSESKCPGIGEKAEKVLTILFEAITD